MKPLTIILLCLLSISSISSQAKTLHTLEQTLSTLYPNTHIKRTTHYLTPEQEQKIAQHAKSKTPPPIIHAYNIFKNDTLKATVYLDKHLVRTLPETLLIAISPQGTIAHLQVLSFSEPPQYMPRKRWYAQLLGKHLQPDLRLKRQIDGVTGATLTARATVSAARRILAIHHLLQKTPPPTNTP